MLPERVGQQRGRPPGRPQPFQDTGDRQRGGGWRRADQGAAEDGREALVTAVVPGPPGGEMRAMLEAPRILLYAPLPTGPSKE
jgi:hypothetical protein